MREDLLPMSIFAISLLVLLQIVNLGNATKKCFKCTSGQENAGAVGTRSFMLNRDMHWPGGVVPYTLDPKFSAKQVRMIMDNFRTFTNVSCVRWKPRKSQPDYVHIAHHNSSGVCNSAVGRKGGRQFLNLGDDCFDVENGYEGAILHEMMHGLGFIHEQQRLDRDCYVKVYSLERPYDYSVTLDTSTSFPYDIGSIMHYGESKTMEPTDEGVVLGNESGQLTKLDVMKLNYMYCGGKTYCQLNPADCQRMKEAEQKCVVKSGKSDFVTHKYKGRNPNKYRLRSFRKNN